MSGRFTFDRMEFAGSLGDLGTLLPIAIAMVLFNGLSALGLFLSIGVFYVVSGVYFGITVSVQPMKVIGAYAIATAMSPDQILASSLLMGVFLLIVGLTGAQKNIDDVLRQLQHCMDAQQMRMLLKEAIPCNECPEARVTEGEKEYDCSCREHFRTEIKNIIRSIQMKTEQ